MSDTGAAAPTWSSRGAFLLASIGSAVGLGSIWKFPYMAGENGGGAFVIVYLIAVGVFILPLLLAEFVIGRRGRKDAAGSFAAAAEQAGASRLWGMAGLWGILGGFLVLSFYAVIGGWTLAFIPVAGQGLFAGIDGAGSAALFEGFLADPVRVGLWHGLFMALTVVIVMLGVTSGLERAVTVLMPALFVILAGLVIYAAATADMAAALRFLFVPAFERLTPQIVLDALGLAFFSIGVGFGVMATYAAYAGRDINLVEVGVWTVAADTVVSLLAGLAIFPLVASYGLDPAQGPGLMFTTLPVAFGQMPGGALVGAAFFVLLAVSALASAISLLELVVAWAGSLGLPRRIAAIAAGGLCWVAGLATVYSFNIWAEVYPLGAVSGFEGRTIYDLIDFLTSNIMLPVGGILIAVFVGYVMKPEVVRAELGLARGTWAALLLVLLRYATPLAVLAVLMASLR